MTTFAGRLEERCAPQTEVLAGRFHRYVLIHQLNRQFAHPLPNLFNELLYRLMSETPVGEHPIQGTSLPQDPSYARVRSPHAAALRLLVVIGRGVYAILSAAIFNLLTDIDLFQYTR